MEWHNVLEEEHRIFPIPIHLDLQQADSLVFAQSSGNPGDFHCLHYRKVIFFKLLM